MTRRTRRRLFVIGGAALIGLSLPFWLPRILSRLPAFQVQHVGVVGTRHVPPDRIVALADLGPRASVWDDPGPVEARVEAHPLVRQARVRRDGLRTLEIRVVEERPVALAPTPALVAVSGEGRVLPLDPAEAGLDLPVLAGPLEVRNGRLADEDARWAAALLGRLDAHDPAFPAKVSEIARARGGTVDIRLLPGSLAGRILLPAGDPIGALRRVELALGDVAPAVVDVADARFRDQVVLRMSEER